MFLNITEPEYRALPCTSYSELATIDSEGPRWRDRVFVMNDQIALGSLVDAFLFEPESVPNRFHVLSEWKAIAPQLALLQDSLIERDDIDNVIAFEDCDVVLEVMDSLNLYKGYKTKESRTRAFNTKPFWGTLSDKIKGKNKTLIPKSVLSEAKRITRNILNDPKSSHFFKKRDGIDVYFQPKHRFTLSGVDLRCMYDIIVIDHNNKTIQPYDLKVTSFKQDEFSKIYLKHHYYLQSALYSKGALDLVGKNFEICDYELLPFTFLVYSIADDFPMLWETSIEDIEKGINGFNTRYGTHIKGVLELAREREFYLDNPENTIPYHFTGINIVKLNKLGC